MNEIVLVFYQWVDMLPRYELSIRLGDKQKDFICVTCKISKEFYEENMELGDKEGGVKKMAYGHFYVVKMVSNG